jgi:SAM-dependent methyltransferase
MAAQQSADRLASEKRWHDAYFAARLKHSYRISDSIRLRYLSPSGAPLIPLDKLFQSLQNVEGKKILCFGCGDENTTALLALKGALIYAFDLSLSAIQVQSQMAKDNGVEQRVMTLCASAEKLPFPDHFFDYIVGTAILHHLPDSIPEAAAEIYRTLKPNGEALFIEPVNRSWLTRAIHKHGLSEVSPGERPLQDSDFDCFHLLFSVHFSYYDFLSRLTDRLPNNLFLKRTLRRIDLTLLKISALQPLGAVTFARMKPIV